MTKLVLALVTTRTEKNSNQGGNSAQDRIKPKTNKIITLVVPVFFHEFLKISPSGLGSEAETRGKGILFRAKSIIGGDLSHWQGHWISFETDAFKITCEHPEKKPPAIKTCWRFTS